MWWSWIGSVQGERSLTASCSGESPCRICNTQSDNISKGLMRVRDFILESDADEIYISYSQNSIAIH